MKKKIPAIILVIIFLAGLSLLLYPSVSNYLNNRNQSKVISDYRKEVENLREEEYNRILDAARDYNLAHKSNVFTTAPENSIGTEEYYQQLRISDYSPMGYLQIEKLGIMLGIYHGTSDSVLGKAIGHLPQTSLPVGGESTHAVISGHTGLPSAELLTAVDTMKIGDTFRVIVLNEVREYRVDQIEIVEPSDVSKLGIVRGKEYVTIMTCTPYGINSHRLLIRGVAVDREAEVDMPVIVADAILIDPAVVAPIIGLPVLVLIVIVIFILRHRKKTRSADRSELT